MGLATDSGGLWIKNRRWVDSPEHNCDDSEQQQQGQGDCSTPCLMRQGSHKCSNDESMPDNEMLELTTISYLYVPKQPSNH